MRHTISILVENEFGVLARVAGLFSGRGFNIDSLSVAKTLDASLSRITLVTEGDDQIVEQITKQLNKLICVIKVSDFQDTPHVEREMALIKVAADERTRGEILNIIDIFRAKVIDAGPRSFVIEVTGMRGKLRPSWIYSSRWASRKSCEPEKSPFSAGFRPSQQRLRTTPWSSSGRSVGCARSIQRLSVPSVDERVQGKRHKEYVA